MFCLNIIDKYTKQDFQAIESGWHTVIIVEETLYLEAGIYVWIKLTAKVALHIGIFKVHN